MLRPLPGQAAGVRCSVSSSAGKSRISVGLGKFGVCGEPLRGRMVQRPCSWWRVWPRLWTLWWHLEQLDTRLSMSVGPLFSQYWMWWAWHARWWPCGGRARPRWVWCDGCAVVHLEPADVECGRQRVRSRTAARAYDSDPVHRRVRRRDRTVVVHGGSKQAVLQRVDRILSHRLDHAGEHAPTAHDRRSLCNPSPGCSQRRSAAAW